MKRYYGKKAWVPKSCPICHNPEYMPVDREGNLHMSDLTSIMAAWYISCDRYQPNFEGIDRWYGRCPKCTLRECLLAPSIWDKKPTPKGWGAEIIVPLTYGE